MTVVLPTIYLIPASLHPESPLASSVQVKDVCGRLRQFVVENEKSARKFLNILDSENRNRQIRFFKFNEQTPGQELKDFLSGLKEDIGVISEVGCPCIADPGADVVRFGHERGWKIVPLVGPSAILLALMGSGLNGQKFAFHGYLSREPEKRRTQLRSLEKQSLKENQTQIFMETPYRNKEVFADLLDCCRPSTLVSLAVDLTAPDQLIRTCRVSQWRLSIPDIVKKPAVFLISCG